MKHILKGCLADVVIFSLLFLSYQMLGTFISLTDDWPSRVSDLIVACVALSVAILLPRGSIPIRLFSFFLNLGINILLKFLLLNVRTHWV